MLAQALFNWLTLSLTEIRGDDRTVSVEVVEGVTLDFMAIVETVMQDKTDYTFELSSNND